MLSPADQAVVRRDPAIRGLAVLLDPPAFAATLQMAGPGMHILAACCRYLHYKPGLVCLARYQVDTDRGQLLILAEAYAESRSRKVERALAAARPGGPFGASRVRFDECAILIRVFPDDPDVPALADDGLLLRLLRDRPDLLASRPVMLRYKPGRRYVARLDGRQGTALLKLYSAAGYEAAARGVRAFRSDASLRLAAPIALSAADRAIVLEWVAGALLRERLSGRDLDCQGLVATGHAIACVHRQTGSDLRPVPRTVQVTGLIDLARSLSLLSPELSARIGEVTAELADRLNALPAQLRPIHGDFDASQVVLGGAGVTLIDFDRAQLGDPATDLGNFVGFLEYDALHDRIAPDSIAGAAEAMLAGYDAATSQVPDPERIRLDTALALLKLAPHPFRQRHPAWAGMTERIVARVEKVLAFSATSPAPPPPERAIASGAGAYLHSTD